MSTTETLAAPGVSPPVVKVPEAQFAALGLIRIVERAVRAHGPVVTLGLPGERFMTILGRASHAAYWHANPDSFFKDTQDPQSGVSMTRAVLGRTLLTADSSEWKAMRRELTGILGMSRPWFQRPLASATRQLIDDLESQPQVPLLEHCILWATRAICEPLFGSEGLDTEARDVVHRLNASFLELLSSSGAGAETDVHSNYDRVMRLVAKEHGPDSIARHVLAASHGQDQVDLLRATVGGLLVASLHINALSLFWALVQLADEPSLQGDLAAEAGAWQFEPRRVVDTPLAFACVREAQRLMPVMAFIERQLRHDITLDGYTMSKGATVLFSPWLVQRGPDWDNPLRFDPGNFASGKRLAPGSYLPFGLGPRICPGTNLVNQQLTFALSAVAMKLRLSPDPANRPGDRAPMFRVNLEPRGPVRLLATPR